MTYPNWDGIESIAPTDWVYISSTYPDTHSALEARFNEASLASSGAAANAAGNVARGGEDVGALTAALAQARGENEALIGKMRELLGRHKALQKTAGELKAAGEEAQRWVGAPLVFVLYLCVLCGGLLNSVSK